MLQPLLARTLQSTHYFSAVLMPPYPSRYSCALRTKIVELTQDFTTDPPQLEFTLRPELSDDAAKTRHCRQGNRPREPMRKRHPMRT